MHQLRGHIYAKMHRGIIEIIRRGANGRHRTYVGGIQRLVLVRSSFKFRPWCVALHLSLTVCVSETFELVVFSKPFMELDLREL